MWSEAEVEEAIGPLDAWRFRCHEASLALVNSGLVGGRVARGWCAGVPSQHSWVIVGDDCFDLQAFVVDVTAWAYMRAKPRVWLTSMAAGYHRPHGWGWLREPPVRGGGEIVSLSRAGEALLSDDGRAWLEEVGPLDAAAWARLASGPLFGWPSGEIVAAMAETSWLAAMVPVDVVGMLTDKNPGGLYLPTRQGVSE